MLKSSSSLLVAILLAGCHVGPDYERPILEMPERWSKDSSSAPSKPTPPINTNWWQSFNDPLLNNLIDEALAANADYLTAAARVSEAQAMLSLNKGECLPFIGLQGSATQNKSSIAATNFPVGRQPYNLFSLSSVLNYEIDLWGHLSRASEAAQAHFLANTSNQAAIRLSVISQVSTGYFTLKMLDAQLSVLKRTLESRQHALDFQHKQLKAQAVDYLSLRQAESELAAVEAQLATLQQARQQQITVVAVLLGRSPKAIVEHTIKGSSDLSPLPAAPLLPHDLPSQLLEQRPDIVAAEQNLIASNANIGVAKANYFPKLSLTGVLGTSSRDTSTLWKSAAENWQVGGAVSGPILDFGRTSSNVDAAIARKDQALIAYQHTIRTAFKEILDALSSQQTVEEQLQAKAKQKIALKDSLRIAEARYKVGYANYLTVLDAQRNLLQTELDHLTTHRDRLTAAVNVFKALGGGWLLSRPEQPFN